MNEHDEHFLKRWSRRKVEAKERGLAEGSVDAEEHQVPHSGTGGSDAGERPSAPPLTEADFAEVDFEALDMQSDYSPFLAPDVPESIRYKALRKLWFADASFTQIEPFQDYAGDFTDAACAVPAGTLKTAYRIGKGFLSDEEVADWEKLGAPELEKAARAPDATEASETTGLQEGSPTAAREEAPAVDETQANRPVQLEDDADDAPAAEAIVLVPGAAKRDDASTA